MAETLGSLVDKLTIKILREQNLIDTINSKKGRFSLKELRQKLRFVKSQKEDLKEEIEDFISAALAGKVKRIKELKLKLYNAAKHIGKIPKVDRLSKAISLLSEKNIELWKLEDEARKVKAGYSYIGRVKRKIDLANQQRNDLIDTIDGLLEKCLKKNVSSS